MLSLGVLEFEDGKGSADVITTRREQKHQDIYGDNISHMAVCVEWIQWIEEKEDVTLQVTYRAKALRSVQSESAPITI